MRLSGVSFMVEKSALGAAFFVFGPVKADRESLSSFHMQDNIVRPNVFGGSNLACWIAVGDLFRPNPQLFANFFPSPTGLKF
jgi:hypothetical protein